jgi:hypothetical protein
MSWLNEHIALIRSRPSNGRKSVQAIDFMLLEINENRERMDDCADVLADNTRQAKKVVMEGNDVLKLHNS